MLSRKSSQLNKKPEKEQHSDSESSQSSEDQDGVLLTDKVQEKLLSIVSKLKNRDPTLYATEKPIFNEEDFEREQSIVKTPDQAQKLTYKDIVKKGYQEDSSSNSIDQQQAVQNIKNKLRQKLQHNNESEQHSMFRVKKKLKVPEQSTEQKIQRLVSSFESNEGKQSLVTFWSDPSKMDEADLFLRDYILEKKWLSSKLDEANAQEQAMVDEEDEGRIFEMDQYEQQYNFRYEEPGGNTITQYPRNVPESVRIKPETRKEKRKRLLQRKKQEQQELRREASELKAKKKQEILDRLRNSEPEMESGSQEEDHDWFFCDDCSKALQQEELHYVCHQCEDYMLCLECFELIIHKHQMEKNRIPKGFGAPKSTKADKILSSLSVCRNCRRKVPNHISHYEYTDKSHVLNILCFKCFDESSLKIKKNFKLVQPSEPNLEQLLENNPQKIKQLNTQKDIEELVDEYIKYDFEDTLAGGLKTKFKYVNVKPESFGLSDEQILFGDDKQLNKYVSIKKLAPYRDQELKLRNSVYDQKIKSIDRSIIGNRKMLGKSGLGRLKNLQKLKNRAQVLKKRRENQKKKLKVVDISNIQDQEKFSLSKSRLESYGLTNS